MKILIDMNLSPQWVELFTASGVEAVHWSTTGKGNAPDMEILSWARVNGYTVFTHDLDFGTILAFTQDRKPSVIQLRDQEVTPQSASAIVISAIKEFSPVLSEGALVTIDSARAKARILPL